MECVLITRALVSSNTITITVNLFTYFPSFRAAGYLQNDLFMCENRKGKKERISRISMEFYATEYYG